MNETTSLERTVEILASDLGDDLGELIVVVSPRTSPESRETIERIAARSRVPLVVHTQGLPYLGGALREAFDLASCTHVVMMASDLETDPGTVKEMVAASRAHPEAIVTASRWAGTRRGRFEGYDPVKRVLNALFQRLFRVLYGSQLSDVTYGFRLFPTLELQNVAWQELRHAFLFETIAKPLRLGVHVVEIPTSWRARIEGRSSNSFVHHLAYVRVALQARFADPRSFRRGPSEAPAAARLAPEAGA